MKKNQYQHWAWPGRPRQRAPRDEIVWFSGKKPKETGPGAESGPRSAGLQAAMTGRGRGDGGDGPPTKRRARVVGGHFVGRRSPGPSASLRGNGGRRGRNG